MVVMLCEDMACEDTACLATYILLSPGYPHICCMGSVDSAPLSLWDYHCDSDAASMLLLPQN